MTDSGKLEWRRPSPALVISCIALFVSLSGSAYALSRGEVKTRHLADNAVKTKKIAKNAVNAGKIGNGSIRTAKLANGVLTTPKFADGSVRAAKFGPIVATQGPLTDVPQFGRISAMATCPAGTRLISGGFQTTLNPTDTDLPVELVVHGSGMSGADTWLVQVGNPTAKSYGVWALAHCLAA